MSIRHHYLKTWPEFFRAVESGIKPFEIRINDRGYQVGDILHLQEFIPPDTFTGREVVKEVTYILDDPQFCKLGYVVMGIKDVPRQLTLDELKQMDGQPVYIIYPNEPGENGWDIMFQEKTSPAGTRLMEFAITEEEIDTYGALWVCFDRPPGGEGR